ncbi:hypothetical protein I350_05157 [Cryptococcus amylolentus CBS 6273]|uniref:C3H1-type domain-containing protein n=1 Tax=Cryptococcus amylolentus CBS 6273 TaxID=1296118 RepID=A0A1E3JUP1_9TREE|nr:hypothetical protein I350_05157 [Cryptococcus amylolentus CBS 6273]
MSVPLPSDPPPITDPVPPKSDHPASAKPIPRSRPTPIALSSSPSKEKDTASGAGAGGGGGGGGGLGATPGSYRYRAGAATSVGKSFQDDNWRDRSPAPPGTLVSVSGSGAKSAGLQGSQTGTKVPEKTIGFEKRDLGSLKSSSGVGAGSGLSREREKKKVVEEKDEDGKTTLSHVPCRFFKAGACTAGESCPFSHAAPDSAKREVCQWFLKGNCKFAHKCALAHVRPGEPMSMDRKNKKAAQLEARERDGKALNGESSGRRDDSVASPVPIRSALSSSIQSPPARQIGSSPMREPFGPPSGALPNSPPAAGFAHSLTRAHPAFASSPNRPSPLSASFGAVGSGLAAGSVPGPLSLKQGNPLSTLRPPVTAAPFSSSFSHSSLAIERPSNTVAAPLSASFAGDAPSLHRSIWSRSDQPPQPLSPRKPIPRPIKRDTVFEDEDDHGEEFLPSSLSDLLTPQERARRMSRRDSDGEAYSPSYAQGPAWTGERLAQSAGATMGQKGFLQGLWSANGEDARKHRNSSSNAQDLTFGPTTAQPSGHRTSLLTQQRSPGSASPTSPGMSTSSFGAPALNANGSNDPYLIRLDPSSPSQRALLDHAPGQSLPGGLANALSRLHMHGPRSPSNLAVGSPPAAGGLGLGGRGGLGEGWRVDEHEREGEDGAGTPLGGAGVKREEHDEGLFAMDG